MLATRWVRQSTRFGPTFVDYDARVLEPRGWTLEQSHWAARLSVACPPGPILELCAGAGQIGLAAAVLTGRPLLQVEVDPVAAGYARDNAARAGLGSRSEVRIATVEQALRPGERFGLIIADPPYLRSEQVADWPADPARAIDGGPDGLAVIRSCIAVADAQLMHGGFFLLQVAGREQAAQLQPALAARRLTVHDLLVVAPSRAIVSIGRPRHPGGRAWS